MEGLERDLEESVRALKEVRRPSGGLVVGLGARGGGDGVAYSRFEVCRFGGK